MSRSSKGSKPGGYEFWSRRPGGRYGIGPYSKRLTHRAERQYAVREVRKILKEEGQ